MREGRKFRMLCVVDEVTRQELAIRMACKLSSADVIDTLAAPSLARGAGPHPLRRGAGVRGCGGEGLDGGRPTLVERRRWSTASPWENGDVESFNGKLRDALLDGGAFNTRR
jgi:hypothetical protein